MPHGHLPSGVMPPLQGLMPIRPPFPGAGAPGYNIKPLRGWRPHTTSLKAGGISRRDACCTARALNQYPPSQRSMPAARCHDRPSPTAKESTVRREKPQGRAGLKAPGAGLKEATCCRARERRRPAQASRRPRVAAKGCSAKRNSPGTRSKKDSKPQRGGMFPHPTTSAATSSVQTGWSFSMENSTMEPSLIWPEMIPRARAFSTCFWRSRLSGRAP